MKFQFCWGTDCPDWLLAEIASLSALTSLKLRMLVSHIADSFLGTPIDAAKILKWTGQDINSPAVQSHIGGIKFVLLSKLYN